MNNLLGLGAVRRLEVSRVPLDLLASLVGNGAQQDGLGQRARVVEVARRQAAGLAGQQPFLLVADRFGEGRIGHFEVGERFPGQENMARVVGQQHALVAHEQHGRVPCRDFPRSQKRRFPAAVVPGEAQRGHVATGGIGVAHDEPLRRAVGIERWALGLNGRGVPELECPEGQVTVVAAKVAQGAVAVGPPVAPAKRSIGRIIGKVLGPGHPAIPVQSLGRGRIPGGPLAAVILGRAPDVYVADRADRPALNQLDHAAIILAGVNLRAHLRHQIVLSGRIDHRPCLGDGVGQRFLAIAMFTQPHGHQARIDVGMVGRADHHGIDLLVHLVK